MHDCIKEVAASGTTQQLAPLLHFRLHLWRDPHLVGGIRCPRHLHRGVHVVHDVAAALVEHDEVLQQAHERPVVVESDLAARNCCEHRQRSQNLLRGDDYHACICMQFGP